MTTIVFKVFTETICEVFLIGIFKDSSSVAIRDTSSYITVFYVILDRAFITVMQNYMMEKLDGSNQSFSSHRGTLSNKEEGNTPMQLRSERQSKLLER